MEWRVIKSKTKSTKHRTEIETRIWQKQIYFILTETSRATNVERPFYYFLIQQISSSNNTNTKSLRKKKYSNCSTFCISQIERSSFFCTNWGQTFVFSQNKLFESIVFIETNLIVKFSFARHPILFLNWVFWALNSTFCIELWVAEKI